MSKYIDADQIRAEIERRWKELADKNVKAGGGKYDAEISTYLSVLVFLDTLPEQPADIPSAGSGTMGTTPPKFKMEVKEQPVEGLEEEIKRMVYDVVYDLDGPAIMGTSEYLSVEDIASIARHFAEWGMNQCPLPEDTTIFMKGVAEGKRLMMEDAVEGYVNYYEDSGGILMAEAQVGCPYHNGDKVKIIIVNEDKKDA